MSDLTRFTSWLGEQINEAVDRISTAQTPVKSSEYREGWIDALRAIRDEFLAAGDHIAPVDGIAPCCGHGTSAHGPAGVSQGCYAKACRCRVSREQARAFLAATPSRLPAETDAPAPVREAEGRA